MYSPDALGNSPNEADTEALTLAAPSSSASRKYKQPAYPEGIPRLVRKGKATYAIGTGPLADDTDWTTISFAVLKEECGKRDMSTSGNTQALRDSLASYKEHEPLDPSMDMSQVVGKGKSSSGEKRRKIWQETPDRTYSNQLAKIKKESICVLGMSDNLASQNFGGPSIEFFVTNDSVEGSAYHVSISKLPSCDCPAKQWRRDETCKHVYAVLVNILKVPEPFTWQKAFLPEELQQYFEPLSEASDGGDISTCNVGQLAAGSCPICFREVTTPEKATVECDVCHINVHHRCFNVWAMHKEGYGSIKCIACHNDWTQPGNWGASGLVADDVAISKTQAEAKAAKASEKAAVVEAKALAKTEGEATRAAARVSKGAAKEDKKRKRAHEDDFDEDDGEW